jgi:hypothetical protein
VSLKLIVVSQGFLSQYEKIPIAFEVRECLQVDQTAGRPLRHVRAINAEC